MAMLASARLTKRRANGMQDRLVEVPVKNGYTLYIGGLVSVDSSGYAVPAGITAAVGERIVGVCEGSAVGQVAPGQSVAQPSAGATGAVIANVGVGEYALDIDSNSPVTIADLFKGVFVTDDHTISRVGSGVRGFAGKLTGIEQYSPTGTQAWVDIGVYVPTGTY